MNIPEHLKPYPDGNLVSFRTFNEPFMDDNYQIHDRTLRHVAFCSNYEMAEFITDCINKNYKTQELTIDYLKSLIRNDGDYIGVDFDGTLFNQKTCEPVEKIYNLVIEMIAAQIPVRIFTARMALGRDKIKFVRDWLIKYNLELDLTNIKCEKLRLLIDDKACRVNRNEGSIVFNFPNNKE